MVVLLIVQWSKPLPWPCFVCQGVWCRTVLVQGEIIWKTSSATPKITEPFTECFIDRPPAPTNPRPNTGRGVLRGNNSGQELCPSPELELQRKRGIVSYLKKQRTLALIGKLVQERVKESFPELKVFEMRPEEMSVSWKRRRKSPAENSCAKALDGREART